MLIALLIALSGWEGKVHFTHDPPRKSGGSEGAIHVAGGRVRIEEPTPMGATVILAAGGKVRLLFPERKQFMEVDPSQSALATVPPLSLEGMQQVGEERIDGRDCAIWERTVETRMGKIRQRLWVPQEPARSHSGRLDRHPLRRSARRALPRPGRLREEVIAAYLLMASSSTSNTSVAPPGMLGGCPWSP